MILYGWDSLVVASRSFPSKAERAARLGSALDEVFDNCPEDAASPKTDDGGEAA